MCRKKKHSYSTKYIDVTRATETILDVLQEKRIDDDWNVDVDRSLTDSWTGFTKFNRTTNFPKDICGPGSDLPRFKQLPGLIVCGLKLGLACQKQLRKRKGKNGLQKNQSSTTLENREHSLHRSGRGERKETIKKSWEKLEVSMEAAMPCKMGTKRSSKSLEDAASETRKVASVESG